MSLWEEYVQAESVEEALTALDQAEGPAAIVAGGTDLLLDLQQARHPAVHTLVDVSRIKAMQGIRLEGDDLVIGAATTHSEIVRSPLVKEHARCLAQACSLVGGPQVRAVATLGGNVAHGLPAGDGIIALMALDGKVKIASTSKERWEEMGSLFSAPGKTTFDRRSEILIEFKISQSLSGEGSAFQRVMRPQGVAIAILNMAVWIRLTAQNMIEDVRLAAGPAGPVPFRGRKIEPILQGRELNEETLMLAEQGMLKEVRLRTSKHRATKSYRQHLLGVLLRRTLLQAASRARAALG